MQFTASFAVAALLFSCTACETATPVTRTAAEEGVQSAAVDAVADSTRPSALFVVSSRTIPWIDSTAAMRRSEIWRDLARHLHDSGLPLMLGTRHSFQMVSADWHVWSQVTDTALVAVSAVGFSAGFDEGLVFVEYTCGTRCGSSAFMIFRRTGTRWVLVDRNVQSLR